MFHKKNILNRMMSLRLLVSLGFAAILSLAQSNAALAQISLGTAESFAILAGSAVTNTGPTVVTGDLGVSPSIGDPPHYTGFPPGIVVGGAIHDADAVAAQAQADNTAAFGFLDQPCTSNWYGEGPKDLTLVSPLGPGVYCADAFLLTKNLTLTGSGVWIFKSAATLTTSPGSSVTAGDPCNVWWRLVSSGTLDTNTSFIGNILALTSIHLNTGATLNGRAFTQTAEVTLDANVVTPAVCAAPAAPTLGKEFNPATIKAGGGVGGVSTLTITLSNPNTSVATLSTALTDTLPSGVVIAPVPNASTNCGGGTTVTTDSDKVTLPSGRWIPASVGGIAGTCWVKVDVTATTEDVFFNTLIAGALQTSNGSNAAPAIATLTVPPPEAVALSKAFSPATITAGGVSTLTITLSNANASDATLTAPLTDTLPSGVVIAPSPNASTTCGSGGSGGGVVGTTANTVSLSTSSTIPGGDPFGTCKVTVNVIAPLVGSFPNTLAAGALQTNYGSNASPAIVTLTITARPAPVPTFSEWGMILFMVLVGLISIYYLRRQKAKA